MYKSPKASVHGHTYTAGLAVLPVFALIKEIFVIDHGNLFCTLPFLVKKNAFAVRLNGEVEVILLTKLETPWHSAMYHEHDNMFIVNRCCHIAQFM